MEKKFWCGCQENNSQRKFCPEFAVVVMAGGAGRRMGNVNKMNIQCLDETTGNHIRREAELLGVPCFISQANYENIVFPGWSVIEDRYLNEKGGFIGPLGGIIACLEEAFVKGLAGIAVTACDMPFFRKELMEIAAGESNNYDAVIWKSRDGKIHPVCGYYSVNCLSVMEDHAMQGDYKMMKVLDDLNVRYIETSEFHLPDRWLWNINRIDDLPQNGNDNLPRVVAISGSKNTGKTTLIEKLVRIFSEFGVKCAVIKHDGHDFEPDVPGTDSYRIKNAGAVGTVVYSEKKCEIVVDRNGEWNAEKFIRMFDWADIILLEGQKSSAYPKIEVMRECVFKSPVTDSDTVLAYAADWEVGEGYLNGKRVFSLNDVEGIAEMIISGR